MADSPTVADIRARAAKPEPSKAYSRLVASAFGGRAARLSIPARPDHDDDLVCGQWMRHADKDRRYLLELLDEVTDALSDTISSQGRCPWRDSMREEHAALFAKLGVEL